MPACWAGGERRVGSSVAAPRPRSVGRRGRPSSDCTSVARRRWARHDSVHRGARGLAEGEYRPGRGFRSKRSGGRLRKRGDLRQEFRQRRRGDHRRLPAPSPGAAGTFGGSPNDGNTGGGIGGTFVVVGRVVGRVAAPTGSSPSGSASSPESGPMRI